MGNSQSPSNYEIGIGLKELNLGFHAFSCVYDRARDVEFFTVGHDSFIIIASSTEENQQLESVIYR